MYFERDIKEWKINAGITHKRYNPKITSTFHIKDTTANYCYGQTHCHKFDQSLSYKNTVPHTQKKKLG